MLWFFRGTEGSVDMAQVSGQLSGTVTFSPEEIATFPQGPPGVDATGYQPGHLTRYVDYANGNDGNHGLTPGLAFKTIQAAYGDLPGPVWGSLEVGGGVVIAMPGGHDVYNGGLGIVVEPGKPMILKSVSGAVGWRHPATTYNDSARLYSSGTITENALITISTDASHDHYGGGCYGIFFDLGTNVGYGIRGYNASRVTMSQCMATGSEAAALEQYLARTEVTGMVGADASWWRFLNNKTYKACLHRAGIDSDDVGSCNQHVWAFNDIGVNVRTQAGIMLYGATRCSSLANNIEGAGSGGVGYGIMLEQARQCMFMGDGGEGIPTFIRAIGTTNNNCNVFAPLGITANQAGKALISDDNPKRNLHLTDFIGWQAGYAEAVPVTTLKTAAYTVLVSDQLIRCDTTSAGFTVTLPTASSATGNRHTIRNYGSNNNITVASAGGSLVGGSSVTAGASATYVSNGTNWYLV